MGTFLTTEKMNPALRGRVERAVSQKARAVHNASRLGLDKPFASRERVRFARIFPVLVALILGALGTVMYVLDKRAVEAERRALTAALAERRALLPKGHEGFLAATDRWIVEGARDVTTADTIDASLRAPGAIEALLRRPAVYVHGPSAELGDLQKLDGAVRGSAKDAFLVCLMQPPASSSERDRLAKVRGVYFGGAKVDDETANVRRLADARIGLKLLGATFDDSVRATDHLAALVKLRRDLLAAPIAEAAKAAAAEVLIVATDMPHGDARVVIVDIPSKTTLLNVRRRLEEQGTSSMASLHRSDLEACSFALAVRKAIGG